MTIISMCDRIMNVLILLAKECDIISMCDRKCMNEVNVCL